MQRRLGIALLTSVLFCSPAAWAVNRKKPAHPAAHPLKRRLVRHPVRVRKPAGPAPAAQLQKDLQAALRRGFLSASHIAIQLSGNSINLSGWVEGAENRGRATEAARRVAHRDRWKIVHVINRLQVR